MAKARGPDATPATPADLAPLFLAGYAEGRADNSPDTGGKDLQVAFFEVWWKHHPDADFEPVPSDLVLASGSGVDPDINRVGAHYQLERIAADLSERAGIRLSSMGRELE